jgi:polyhydroxyalkanoic acid synthase PhaR subunit
MWSDALNGSRESLADPYGLYRTWLKSMADTQQQFKNNLPWMMDPREAWKQWIEATIENWKRIVEAGGDPLGLTSRWMEMMEEMRAKMLAGGTFPADPFTLFKQWYDASSETWSKAVGDVIGSEKFMESVKRFLESYTSFYKTFRRASEEYFRNLQIPTRSDVARVAELVVALEEKVDRIDDALEDAQDERQHWSTQQGVISEAISSLVGRLGMVESKVDVLPAALEKIEAADNIEPLTERLSHVESKVDTLPTALQKIEAANNVEHLTERMNRIESKLDTLLAALEKIEAKANTANIKPTGGTQRKSQKKAADTQVSNNTADT